MVEDAVRAADASVDYSRYDNDGPDGVPASGDDDGQVDALVVVHAGDGAELGDPNMILSHFWYTQATVPTHDGVFAWAYATVSETSPVGVRAHEFGHLLGLPDLYDRRVGTASRSGGLGAWSLMAAGAWLGDGETPCDLDAPSKVQLGFVDPIAQASNATGLPLRNLLGQLPDVYQVWTHGRPTTEFLVIENRRRAGLDVALPASGMLVYHVDLQQATNDDPHALRVQLLQADGLAEIDSLDSNGDAGDPFPGTGGIVRIDASTRPDTRARDGSDTQIVVSGIGTPSSIMTFDLQVENTPAFEILAHTLSEVGGDGDGIPESGERLGLSVTLRNFGLGSGSVGVEWLADPAAAVEWVQPDALLPPIAKGGTPVARAELVPAATLGDPEALRLTLRLTDQASGTAQPLDLHVGLGEQTGFLACLEAVTSLYTRDCADPAGAWEVDRLAGTGTWQLEHWDGDLGGVYHSADSLVYAPASDVALVSPPFNLHAGSRLELLHAYDFEDFAAGWAADGARVEIQVAGGTWEPIEPDGGYPRRMFPESIPHLAHAGVFAGATLRRWDAFDLGDRAGSARIRFRCASNASAERRGWDIFRVEVHAAAPVEPAAGVELQAEPNPVRFPTRVAFRVVAPRDAAARTTQLRIFDVRGRLVRHLTHAAVPAQSAMFTWDGTDHAGRAVSSGMYWARLEWGSESATRKLVVVD
jgi:M6 family metalloprotease-like protein